MTQALLIMDVQNGIVDRFGAAEAYLDRVVAAQERAEQAGGRGHARRPAGAKRRQPVVPALPRTTSVAWSRAR